MTNAEYVYGDSVAPYTPIIVRLYGKTVLMCTISKLPDIVTNYELMHYCQRTLFSNYTGNIWRKCTEPGKQDKEYCNFPRRIVDIWSENGWTSCTRIIRHKLAPHKKMWRISTPTGLVDVTDDHSLLRPDGTEVSSKDLDIGAELLHHACNTNNFAHYTFGLRPRNMENLPKIGGWDLFDTQIKAAQHFSFVQTMGYMATIEETEYMGSKWYCVSVVDEIIYPTKITSMREINKTDVFVYDLTTENHHFAAGIGNMIVHNTDSVFFTFNLKDPTSGADIRGKRALEITIEIAQDVAHLCTKFLKSPMELAYEKTLMPFILLSKKRYVGMLYETNPKKGKLKYMGLSLKRRDSCDYLKDTYGAIISMLMAGETVTSTINYLTRAMTDLIEERVPIEKLMLTRSLRSDYKNPAQIAHKVLADRIAKRDPGNKPKSGDRLKFAYIVNSNPRALLGERVETPEFIRENRLKIDYTYYITNQLMKPLQQLFGLAIEQIYIERGKGETAMRTYRRELEKLRREYPDLEVFMKKKEAYCSKEVKRLLFDGILNKIQNERAGNREITSFWGRIEKK